MRGTRIVGIALGCVLALVLAAAALGTLAVEGEALRGWVRAEAVRRIGREAGYESLAIGFFPLRAELTGAFLAGSGPGSGEGDPPLLEADRATLPVDLRALLAGRPDFGVLELPEATLRPFADLRLDLRDLRVAIRRVRVDGGDTLRLDASAAIQPSGSLALRGNLAPDGTLELELDAFDLAMLGDAFRSVEKLAGAATGRVVFSGSGGGEIRAELQVPDMVLRIDDLFVSGPVQMELTLPALSPGRLRIDATRALLETRGPVRYRKEAGSPGEVTGRVVRRPDGSLDLIEARLSISSR
ncbi:MAG: hypothetical protein O7G30_18195 [Proteobacteria bacterium]|nr:hypothetical protein [Pseudomonadota bacterium]